MYPLKKYTDQQRQFIKNFIRSGPKFAEFRIRYKEHLAKRSEPGCGMTPADICECEEGLDYDITLSTYGAWFRIYENLRFEKWYLLHLDYELREKAEAAWRARPIQRIKAAFRGFLRELRLPA